MRRTTTSMALAIALVLGTTAAAFAHDVALVENPNLTIHNNGGAYHHDYNIAYTCSTDHEGLVLLGASTGKAADNAGETVSWNSYINWNDNTFNFESTYDRADNYTFTIHGAIAADGSFTGIDGTGGVRGAEGRFLDVPRCAFPSDPDPDPIGPDTCKNGAWVGHSEGPFKNQGQCVAFFASGGKNMKG